jgi:UDP-N-acetylglucosamine transferase subunit ALG13
LHNSPLPGISGIPSLPRKAIPRVIGTELHFISDGKIYIGLIRECKENELIVQVGNSTNRTIRFEQIIGVTAAKQIKHTFKIEVNIFIRKEDNRVIVDCNSQSAENINGVMFYSIAKNKEDRDWSGFIATLSNLGVYIK